ncbi:MAG: hypothetical protein QMD92_06630 [bacterium]|nr:hypothetical protein [bacterium]
MFITNIFVMFFKRNLKLTLSLSIGTSVLFLWITYFFPNLDEVDALVFTKAWPPLAKSLFGDPLTGFSTLEGWLNLQIFHMTIWMISGGLISLLSTEVITKEIETRKIDLILSFSLKRSQLIVSRFLASLVLLLILQFFILIGIYGGILLCNGKFRLVIIYAMIAGIPLYLTIGSITLLMGLFFRQIPTLVICWTFFSISFAVEEVFSKISPIFSKLSPLCLFHYYKSGDILIRNIFSWADIITLLVISMIVLIFSIFVFREKDVLI